MNDRGPKTTSRRPVEPPPGQPVRRSNPLLWIVVLLALLALGWFVYNQSVGRGPAPGLAPPAIGSGDARDAAAEHERASATKRAGADTEAAERTGSPDGTQGR